MTMKIGVRKSAQLRRLVRGSLLNTMNRNIFHLLVQKGARSLQDIKALSAMTFINKGRPMVNHIKNMLVPIGVAVNLSWIKVIITFLAFCNKLRKDAGMKMLVIYLKACSVSLQQAAGGMRLSDMSPLGTRFRRTGSGLPCLIPALHRKFIRNGSTVHIKFWLTLFNLYRILEIPVKAKIQTITSPSTMDSGDVLPKLGIFIPIFVRQLATITGNRVKLIASLHPSRGPLWLMSLLKAKPFAILKSTPTARSRYEDISSPLSTSPAGLILSAKAWHANPKLHQIFSDWCTMTGSQYLLNRIQSWSKVPSSNLDAKGSLYLGKLGFKEEAAGKLRVFAMVDPYTQWALKPLWDLILEVLSKLPQDGTLNQMNPVSRLMRDRPKGPFYSFDLSAATDRLPVIVQAQLLGYFLGSHAANLWKAILIGRGYYIPDHDFKGIPSNVLVHYETGQPMGALTSWGMLAFTHHLMVQWSAYRANPISYTWFKDYAVLGDDIVIADTVVANEYVKTCQLLGVEIGLAKSLISKSGTALEFAKRTFVNQTDVSPVPFKEYWVAIQMIQAGLEFARKYNLSAPQFLKLNGAGWRVLSQHSKPFLTLGKRWRNLLIAFCSPSGVNPLSMVNFLMSKSLTKVANVRDDIKHEVLYTYLKSLIKSLLDKINPDLPIWSLIRKLVTVTKYYGNYSSPTAPPIVLYNDIIYDDSRPIGPQKDLLGPITEDMNSIVYRSIFLDVPSDVRDIRNELDAILESDSINFEVLESTLERLNDLIDQLENLPIGSSEFYIRKSEVQVKIREFSLTKAWLQNTHIVNPRRPLFSLPSSFISVKK